MQRQLSSFDIYTVVSELQELVGCQIEKIYQITRDEFLIRLKNIETKDKQKLYIRNGELICTTKKTLEIPTKPSTFAMTLRKYLQNGRITEIIQHEFDRIIKIKIGKKEGEYTLVVEFFSNGNIILVDPNENIILPLIRQAWAHRKLKGREPYVPPPSQIDPFDLTLEKFSELIKESDSDIVRTLAVNINLSGPIAEEICLRARIDKRLGIDKLDDKLIKKIFDTLLEFLELFKEKKFNPVFVKKDGLVVDVLPFEFISYQNFDFEKSDSVNKGFEEFIGTKKVEKKIESKTEKYLGKLNRQLDQQKVTIKKFQREIDIKKIEGDLIYLNYQEIEKLLNDIKTVLDLKEKDDEIDRINEIEIVKKFRPTENLLEVNLKDTTGNHYDVKLNFRKTVAENAEKAYADNKKLRSKLRGAEISIKKTKEKIESAKKENKIIKEKQKKETKKEQMFWFEHFRWFISSDGNIVIGGKDAKTNEIVVKKYLKEGDRYAHADIQGAPSIIIKSKGIDDESIDISKETLEEACIFAASFSKAWKQFAEAQAYWVNPEQVSKTAQSGEFVPKGAFIIRGKRNYNSCKLEVAVGLIKIKETKKVMCGPVNAVEKRSDKYVVINPGDVKKNDIAHKLAKTFDINIDSFDRVLPPGGISIKKAKGVEL